MTAGRNPGIVEEALERRPVGTFQNIEMHRMFRSLDPGRSHKGGIPQGLRVGSGDGATPNIIAVEVWKFCPKNGGLKFIESRVSAWREAHIALTPAIFPKHPDRIGQSGIVRHDRSGVSERAEVLRRVKAKCGGITECAHVLSPSVAPWAWAQSSTTFNLCSFATAMIFPIGAGCP